MAPWGIEYFKTDRFEKWHVQQEVSDLLICYKTVIWDVSVLYLEERSILVSEEEETGERNLKVQELLRLLPLARFHPITSFCDFPLFIKPSKKSLRFKLVFKSSFPYEALLYHVKFILSMFIWFSPLVYLFSLCWSNFEIQPRTLRGSRKSFIPVQIYPLQYDEEITEFFFPKLYYVQLTYNIV